MEGILRKTRLTLEMIKFSHSIFALPFALGAMLVAANGLPNAKVFTLILVCMVAARSATMAYNRLVDAEIDALNPRTQNRHLPQKLLSKKFVLGFILLCSALFLWAADNLNSLTFYLSPLVLIFLFGYSHAKHFTWLTHLWLGTCLGLAPLAAWIAVTGQWPWPTLPLGLAVFFWVAGFDIIYATQDETFDRNAGLHSIVARFGIKRSLIISKIFHLLSVFSLFWFGHQNHLGAIYTATVVLIAAGLAYEQSLIKPTDLSKVNAAFFNMNGIISIVFLLGILLEINF